jgi:glutamate-1-semialdehyde 2,1-aminomutase
MTECLCGGITNALNTKGIAHQINRIGSMFTLFFNDSKVTDYDSAAKSDTKRYGQYFRHMLESGVYLPPSQFEANFLSTAHEEKHIEKTLKAVGKLEL